jgi:hypothetical protein
MSAGPYDQSQTWSETLSLWLISYAARRAPLDLADRLAEEWQADCNVRTSALSQLRFALGCCWATRVIAREHRPAMIPVVVSLRGPITTMGQVSDESGRISRRASLFFLVAGLHVALFYCLMTGLAFRIIAVMPVSLQHQVTRAAPDHALPPELMTARIEFPQEPMGMNR